MTTHTPEGKRERLAKIMIMLSETAMTNTQIAEAMNLDRSTTRIYLKDLRSKIYIASWVKPRNHVSPAYKAGNLPDAEIPSEWEFLEEQEPEELRPKVRVNVIRHWLDVALFGEYRAAFPSRHI